MKNKELIFRKKNVHHWVFHPFLFSAYVVLAPLAKNIHNLEVSGARSFFIGIIGTILILGAFRLFIKDGVKVGLISSGTILLLFSYGHVKSILQNWCRNLVSEPEIILFPIWIILIVLWGYWVLRKTKNPLIISQYMNWVSLVLIIFPLFDLWSYSTKQDYANDEIQRIVEETQLENNVRNLNYKFSSEAIQKPDIYYILLDAYGRQDVLTELYGYDNSHFLESLEHRGFYIATESNANYLDTQLSMASSLNMTHINTLPSRMPHANFFNNKWVVNRMAKKIIRDNQVGYIFQNLNYSMVVFHDGYEGPVFDTVDIYENSPEGGQRDFWETSFELMILDTSFAKIVAKLFGKESLFMDNIDSHRERIMSNLAGISKYAEAEGDYFVFVHVVCPHTPYVFDWDGKPMTNKDPYTLLDLHPGNPENIVLYRNQLHYLNSLVIDAIDDILEKSTTDPIIILQSDHGSKVFNTNNPSGQIAYKLYVPILNAYYFPGVNELQFYPTISPVNTFRFLLNTYFGSDLPLLEDRAYQLSTIDGFPEFIDACIYYNFCDED